MRGPVPTSIAQRTRRAPPQTGQEKCLSDDPAAHQSGRSRPSNTRGASEGLTGLSCSRRFWNGFVPSKRVDLLILRERLRFAAGAWSRMALFAHRRGIRSPEGR